MNAYAMRSCAVHVHVQAGLLLTGLLWRGCGPLARRHLRAAPRLLDALAARVTTGELVALWALREAAADAASATVLYERGAAGGLGRALRGLVQEAEAEGEAQGGEGEEEAGKGRAKDGQGGGKGRWEDEWPLGSREEREVVAAARTVLVAGAWMVQGGAGTRPSGWVLIALPVGLNHTALTLSSITELLACVVIAHEGTSSGIASCTAGQVGGPRTAR